MGQETFDLEAEKIMSEKLQDLLKSTREKKRFSLLTVHQETRISVAYLEAMESGRWEVFPAEVYRTGFLRKYAAYLGLNPDQAFEMYRKEQFPETPAEPAPEKASESKPRSGEESAGNAMAQAAVLVFLVFILAGIVLYGIFSRSPGKPANPPEALELKDKFSRSSFVQSEEITLGVQALENVWVRIVSDDKLAFEGFLPPGTQRDYPAKNELRIRIGNANALKLSLNGKLLNPRVGAKQDVNELVLTHQSLLDESLLQANPEAPKVSAAPAESAEPRPAVRRTPKAARSSEVPAVPAPPAPKEPAASSR
jgi:transcriptional regulator with XRE-family HTH domain